MENQITINMLDEIKARLSKCEEYVENDDLLFDELKKIGAHTSKFDMIVNAYSLGYARGYQRGNNGGFPGEK